MPTPHKETLSLHDRILAANDLQTHPVEVPEWGVTVHVKMLTGDELDDLCRREESARESGKRNLAAYIVIAATVDEHGKNVFTIADFDALMTKSSSALLRVSRKANQINGLGKLKILEKN